MEHLMPALVGLGGLAVAPWPIKALWRLWRGPAEKATAAAAREARSVEAELERLLAEIARLTARHGDLEELVDLLRRELDKALVRGNATLTMARILLFAVDQEPKPSPAMIAARAQAQQVIKAADAQMNRGG